MPILRLNRRDMLRTIGRALTARLSFSIRWIDGQFEMTWLAKGQQHFEPPVVPKWGYHYPKRSPKQTHPRQPVQ